MDFLALLNYAEAIAAHSCLINHFTGSGYLLHKDGLLLVLLL